MAYSLPIQVAAVAAENVTQRGIGATIDGVKVAAGDVILCTGQDDAKKNGLWVARDGDWWYRHPDFDVGDATSGQLCMVMGGATYAGSIMAVYGLAGQVQVPIEIGVTDIVAMVLGSARYDYPFLLNLQNLIHPADDDGPALIYLHEEATIGDHKAILTAPDAMDGHDAIVTMPTDDLDLQDVVGLLTEAAVKVQADTFVPLAADRWVRGADSTGTGGNEVSLDGSLRLCRSVALDASQQVTFYVSLAQLLRSTTDRGIAPGELLVGWSNTGNDLAQVSVVVFKQEVAVGGVAYGPVATDSDGAVATGDQVHGVDVGAAMSGGYLTGSGVDLIVGVTFTADASATQVDFFGGSLSVDGWNPHEPAT